MAKKIGEIKLYKNNLLIILAFILVLVIVLNLNSITGNVTQEDCSCINADVNRDKILDVRDLNIIVDCVNNKNSCNLALADINKDKLVNNLDLSLYNECHRKEIPSSCYSTNLNVVSGNKVVYAYANNQRIAKKDSSGVYYYHNDNLGSPRAISDGNGDVITRIDYKPFGEEITSSNEKIKYNSKELDKDTNLLYYGARYYSSYNGRFLTADSVKGSLTDPQSMNLYSYTKNNPLKYIDPSGNGEKLAFLVNPYSPPHINKFIDKIIDATAGVYDKIEKVIGLSSKDEQKSIIRQFEEKGFEVNVFEATYENLLEVMKNDEYKHLAVSGHGSWDSFSLQDEGPKGVFTNERFKKFFDTYEKTTGVKIKLKESFYRLTCGGDCPLGASTNLEDKSQAGSILVSDPKRQVYGKDRIASSFEFFFGSLGESIEQRKERKEGEKKLGNLIRDTMMY